MGFRASSLLPLQCFPEHFAGGGEWCRNSWRSEGSWWAEFHTQERLLKEWLWHDTEQSQQLGSNTMRLHCSGAPSYGLQHSLAGSGIDPAGRGDVQHFL